MAARENQGLHIALILFVMLTVLLAVLCYFTFTSANEMGDKLEVARADEKKAQDRAEAYKLQANLVKAYIGFGTLSPEDAVAAVERMAVLDSEVASETEEITQAYEEDMKKFDQGYTGVRNYRNFPQIAEDTITRLHGTVNENVKREETLINEKETSIAAANEAKTVAENKAADHLKMLETRTNEFSDLTKAIQNDQQASAQRAAEVGEALKAEQTLRRDQVGERDAQIAQLTDTLAKKTEKLEEYEAEEFDIADGRITNVSARAGIVWINVGLEDNLPQNATFAVYPQDSAQFRAEGVKATIKVKRIFPNSAEATITYEKVSDPIVPGDVINTTTWSPGRQQSFAISGFIDIDGDKRSDAERLRSIITQNGGRVVAYIDENGDVQGEIDAKTRYLITGDDYPAGGNNDGLLQKRYDATSRLNDQASAEAVEKKYYQELLEEMGYRGEMPNAGQGDSEFVPRRPPGRGSDGSAY